MNLSRRKLFAAPLAIPAVVGAAVAAKSAFATDALPGGTGVIESGPYGGIINPYPAGTTLEVFCDADGLWKSRLVVRADNFCIKGSAGHSPYTVDHFGIVHKDSV